MRDEKATLSGIGVDKEPSVLRILYPIPHPPRGEPSRLVLRRRHISTPGRHESRAGVEGPPGTVVPNYF